MTLASCVLAATLGAAPAFHVPAGTPGVVRIKGRTSDGLELQIVLTGWWDKLSAQERKAFSNRTDATFPVTARGEVALFDEQGLLGRVSADFVTHFWCENDGGIQFRPEAVVTVPAARLARPLRSSRKGGGIVAFAAIVAPGGELPRFAKSRPPEDRGRVLLAGKAGGGTRAYVLSWQADDGCEPMGGGKEGTQGLSLYTGGDSGDPLVCCGP